jgi:hypothetical protein
MIKNEAAPQKFERELARKEKVDVVRNLRLVEAMYEEARFLGVFPPRDPLSGIEVDVKIARVVNSVRKTPF